MLLDLQLRTGLNADFIFMLSFCIFRSANSSGSWFRWPNCNRHNSGWEYVIWSCTSGWSWQNEQCLAYNVAWGTVWLVRDLVEWINQSASWSVSWSKSVGQSGSFQSQRTVPWVTGIQNSVQVLVKKCSLPVWFCLFQCICAFSHIWLEEMYPLN